MIIAGAGGHAKEVIGVLAESNITGEIFFFDDYTPGNRVKLFNEFTIIKTEAELKERLKSDRSFVLGTGNPELRSKLCERFTSLGGRLTSVISPFAQIGKYNVQLGEGLNIMTNSVITQDVVIGKGSLIHIQAIVHHDCIVGEFCELSPGCKLLGKVKLGSFVSVGTGAIILPGLSIGNHVVIGAGAVVTKDIPDGLKVAGIPAKVI